MTAMTALGFGPDAGRLWTQDGKIFWQWDSISGKQLDRAVLPGNAVFGAVISPNGKYVANPPRAKKAGQIASVLDGKKVGELSAPAMNVNMPGPLAFALSFSPDGSLLALRNSKENKIELYALPSCKLLQSLGIVGAAPKGAARTLASSMAMFFSNDGKLLAGYTEPGTFSVWDTGTGKKQMSVPLTNRLTVLGGTFLPDGRSMALDLNDGTVSLWELASGGERRTFGKKPALVKGSKGSAVQLLMVPNRGGQQRASLAASPDGKWLAHAGADRAIHIWDTKKSLEVGTFRGHTGNINSVIFAPDGKTLASASDDTTALVWDLRTVRPKEQTKVILAAADLEARWQALRGDNAAEAFNALCDLTASPAEAVGFFKERLKPAPAVRYEGGREANRGSRQRCLPGPAEGERGIAQAGRGHIAGHRQGADRQAGAGGEKTPGGSTRTVDASNTHRRGAAE